jgi:hypothetical protein
VDFGVVFDQQFRVTASREALAVPSEPPIAFRQPRTPERDQFKIQPAIGEPIAIERPPTRAFTDNFHRFPMFLLASAF